MMFNLYKGKKRCATENLKLTNLKGSDTHAGSPLLTNLMKRLRRTPTNLSLTRFEIDVTLSGSVGSYCCDKDREFHFLLFSKFSIFINNRDFLQQFYDFVAKFSSIPRFLAALFEKTAYFFTVIHFTALFRIAIRGVGKLRGPGEPGSKYNS